MKTVISALALATFVVASVGAWSGQSGPTATQKSISAQSDVNAQDSQGMTALMVAAKNGNVDRVKTLIAVQADVKLNDTDGDTALVLAAQHGHAACVKVLIAAKSDVNAKGYGGDTALMAAAYAGYTDCLRALIAAHADTSLKNTDGKTALNLAVATGHDDCVKSLGGATESMYSLQAYTSAIEQAAFAKVAEDPTEPINSRYAAAGMIQDARLLDRVARVAVNKGTRIQTIQTLRKLITEAGPNLHDANIILTVEPVSEVYSTLSGSRNRAVTGERLTVSIKSGNRTIFTREYLTKFPKGFPDLDPADIIVHSDVELPGNVDVPAIVDLIELIADTCLAENFTSSQVEVALATIAARDADDRIWEHAVLYLKHIDMSRAFGMLGMGWTAHVGRGGTALHLAATENIRDVAQALAVNKSLIDAKDRDGYTPLHLASLNGNNNIVQLLLANKAHVNATDNLGHTPLYYAIERRGAILNNPRLNSRDTIVASRLKADLSDFNDVAKTLRQHGGHE